MDKLPELKRLHKFERSEYGEDVVCVDLRSYRGQEFIDIRLWYKSSTGEALLPTKKGLGIPLNKFKELMKGLNKLNKVYKALCDSKEKGEAYESLPEV